jgi:hypothetical protein
MDESYHKMSGPWLAKMPWSVHLAAYSTRKALLEACGLEPLVDLEESVIYGEDGEALPGTEWSDEQLCSDEIGDTASSAAVAHAAVSPNSFASHQPPTCDPIKLREFWTWRLAEAIPAAWEAASSVA